MDAATLNLIVGSFLGLLVSLVTTGVNSFLAAGRERHAEKRKVSQNYLASLEKLYEDVLDSLYAEFHLLGTAEHREEHPNEMRRFNVRLRLMSTDDITKQFQVRWTPSSRHQKYYH